MKAWWQSLNTRERRLVTIAAALLAMIFLWLLIWKPLARHYTFLQQDLQVARDANQQMQQQRGEILSARGASPDAVPLSSENLYSAVTNLLKQHQLDGEGSSSDSQERDKVRIKLTGKPFDALARFLDQMEHQYAAHVSSMTLKPAKESGLIDAEILLQR